MASRRSQKNIELNLATLKEVVDEYRELNSGNCPTDSTIQNVTFSRDGKLVDVSWYWLSEALAGENVFSNDPAFQDMMLFLKQKGHRPSLTHTLNHLYPNERTSKLKDFLEAIESYFYSHDAHYPLKGSPGNVTIGGINLTWKQVDTKLKSTRFFLYDDDYQQWALASPGEPSLSSLIRYKLKPSQEVLSSSSSRKPPAFALSISQVADFLEKYRAENNRFPSQVSNDIAGKVGRINLTWKQLQSALLTGASFKNDPEYLSMYEKIGKTVTLSHVMAARFHDYELPKPRAPRTPRGIHPANMFLARSCNASFSLEFRLDNLVKYLNKSISKKQPLALKAFTQEEPFSEVVAAWCYLSAIDPMVLKCMYPEENCSVDIIQEAVLSRLSEKLRTVLSLSDPSLTSLSDVFISTYGVSWKNYLLTKDHHKTIDNALDKENNSEESFSMIN